MYNIGIITDGKNYNEKQLRECFSKKKYAYNRFNSDSFDICKTDSDYCISEYLCSEKIEIKEDIIVLCCEHIEGIKINNNAIVLLDSAEFSDYSALPENSMIISCGFGEKNSISLSSICDNAIVLNIAREVNGLEIQEFVIKINKPIENIYTAIFAYAVLILTNKEEPPCIQDIKAI